MPEDWLTHKKYHRLQSIATYMAEIAKIELSADERVKIEGETGIEDETGEEIYLDVEIERAAYEKVIAEPLTKAIETARETIKKSGLTASDIDKIIFIGGPNCQELKGEVETFSKAIKPLDKMAIAIGANHFDETENIFYEIRNVAIKLFNEKNFINDPLIITRMLEENFSYLPSFAEKIREDIKFLDETKERQPTSNFLDAKAALDNVQATIDKNLHFKKGLEQVNLDFYERIFKQSLVFDLIRLANNTTCKPGGIEDFKGARGRDLHCSRQRHDVSAPHRFGV